MEVRDRGVAAHHVLGDLERVVERARWREAEAAHRGGVTADDDHLAGVLLAMGASPDDARSTLRFSLGHTSTAADVDALIAASVPDRV